MSKGSKIIPVRIPDELLTDLENAVKSANSTRREMPYTVSAWIRKCVEEKLAHLKRSRKRPPGRTGHPRDTGNIPPA